MTISRRMLLGAALTTSFAPSRLTADAADICVSTAGDDRWSGRLPQPSAQRNDGPLATPHRALQMVAQLRQSQPARIAPIVVSLRRGVYHLSRPL